MQSEKVLIIDFFGDYKKRMADTGKAIWGFAELGLNEVQSSALLAEELERRKG